MYERARRQPRWLIRGTLLAAAAIIVSACGGDSYDSTDSTATPAAPAETSVAETSTPSAPDADVYSTSEFVIPFELPVPAWLAEAEVTEEPNFVTWAPVSEFDPAVRFLVPVVVYPPGGTGTMPVPDDYVAYLQGQTDYGATLTDVTQTTVGDFPATIVTATVTEPGLDGSLGCPAEELTADVCFGLQSEFTLRIAVIDTGDSTVLVWARHLNEAGDEQRATTFSRFEELLASVQFVEN